MGESCARWGSQKPSKKVQFSETHAVEEPDEVQKPAAVPREPVEEVQELTEAVAATPTIAESKPPHDQAGELLPATELTHHLDTLFYQESFQPLSPCREDAVPAAAVAKGMRVVLDRQL